MNFMNSEFHISINGQPEEKLAELLKSISLSDQESSGVTGWIIQAEKDKFRPVAASPGDVVRLETELRKFFETRIKW